LGDGRTARAQAEERYEPSEKGRLQSPHIRLPKVQGIDLAMISVPVQAHEEAPAGRQKNVALGARDAGLDMVMGELTTARDLNLPVIVSFSPTLRLRLSR
jgi:hypothetical protein